VGKEKGNFKWAILAVMERETLLRLGSLAHAGGRLCLLAAAFKRLMTYADGKIKGCFIKGF